MPFVTDTFSSGGGANLSAHTGETGATWTEFGLGAGTIFVTSTGGRVRENAFSAAEHYYASGVPAGAEYDVQADVFWPSSNAHNTNIGISGRFDTAAHQWYRTTMQTGGGGFNTLALTKRVSGVETDLGSTLIPDWTASTSKVMLLEIRNAAKKVYWDGVVKLTSADNTVTAAGKVGIYANCLGSPSDTTSVQIDNFSATDAAGASSLSRSIADTVTIGDAVVRSSLARSRALADTITISDALARTVAESRSLADAVTIDDALARSAVAQSRTAGDMLTITDAVDASSIASLTRDIADTITIGDAVARMVGLGRGVADSVTIGDALARSAVSFVRAIADTITITDSLSRQVSTTAQVRTVTRYSATTRPVGQHGAGTRAVGQHRSGVNP